MEENQTVTTPDEQLTRLQEELARVSIPALRTFLERLGYNAPEEAPKAALIDAIMKIEKAKVEESDKQVAAATAQIAADDDPLVEMTFVNVESPGADIEFTYDGGKGFPKGPGGAVLPLPKFHFYPDRTYKVPLSVVNHLNSLKVAPDSVVNVNADGFVSSLYSGAPKKNRFSCVIQFTNDQIRSLQKGK